MIVLTGATGGLGSQVLKHIVNLVPASDIVISTTDPGRVRASDMIPPGVEVREGDFLRPATLPAAFAGADALLLVSYPSIAHSLRVSAHKNAIDAARAAGVRRVFYTSLAFGDSSSVAVMRAHLDTEAYLKQSGLAYTIIREGTYAEVAPLFFGFFNPSTSTEVYVPGDGPVAWAARDDLGEATAKIVAGDAFPNATVLLSGPGKNVLTLAQLAEFFSTQLGREVRLHVVSVDEYVRRHTNALEPRGDPDFLREWATTYDALIRGDLGVVDPLLERMLGRPARTMADCMKDLLKGEGEENERYAK
ncbi:NAD(P)-binding protein [Vararia minispora EC-137]|uniref:NAD(P)-binding protein n=1 Tax=Vararia minispora EC-137 TaxID=1314806 RepID=A0ACB8QHH3_9AGAM|nr:NAD(P)-binding protein [Vararia minispora EC-137]